MLKKVDLKLAPTLEELTKSTNLAPETVSKSLKQLEDLHHLVLYKEGVLSPTPIAMIHPFPICKTYAPSLRRGC